MIDGIKVVVDERAKQIARGYDGAHDDQYGDGELALAAAYIGADESDRDALYGAAPAWACDLVTKHNGNRFRQLAIAGALIVAEIERLQRQAR